MAEGIKRIIFLDIDGVCAGYEYLGTGRGYIDPNCIKRLNKLAEIGAEVVISSSWGYDEGRTEKSLRDCGLTLPIIGYTEHFHCEWQCRGNEIEKWLLDTFGGMATKFGGLYQNRDYEYVIFDDDTDMLLGQKDNFIQTDERIGLTTEDINKAIKILTRYE